jgi:hypothetical protein
MKRKMPDQRSVGRKSLASGTLGLRVALVPEDNGWFAQGLDVDYFAAGATESEAKSNFEKGLLSAARLSALSKFGPAPKEVWDEYKRVHFSKTTPRPLELRRLAPDFPYTKVLYLEKLQGRKTA